MKKVGAVIRNEEFRLYVLIVAASTLLIAVNIMSIYGDFITALRYSFFQVSSIITTTGFATADFNLLPQFSKVLLVLLMMIGACSGSTAGGIKVSRVLILFSCRQFGNQAYAASQFILLGAAKRQAC